VKLSLVLIFCLLLVSLPVIHAQEDQQWPLTILRENGFGAELNQTQTVDDTTITLVWAYADVNQLALDLTVSPAPASQDAFYYPQVILVDANGNEFSFASLSTYEADNALGFNLSFYTQVIRPGDTPQVDNDYFANEYGDDLPDSLDLSLQLVLTYSNPEAVNDGIGPFTFNFSTPLYPAVELEPMISTEASDIQMELQSIRTTPSETQVVLCFDLPTSEDWQPDTVLTLNDVAALPMGYGMTERPMTDDVNRCFNIQYAAVYDSSEPTTLTLTVDRLLVSEPSESPAFWDDVQAALAEQDIMVEFTLDHGVAPEIISLPDGMTEEQFWMVLAQVREDLRDSLAGPWVFSVELSS
jgi:hypothetical protein